MRIRMLVSIAGPEYVLQPGDERDFDKTEAMRLVKAGFAVAASEKKEKATDRRRATQETR